MLWPLYLPGHAVAPYTSLACCGPYISLAMLWPLCLPSHAVAPKVVLAPNPDKGPELWLGLGAPSPGENCGIPDGGKEGASDIC